MTQPAIALGRERERRTAVPPLLWILVLAAAVLCVARALSSSLSHAGFARIDTRRAALAVHPREGRLAHWIDERWCADLADLLAGLADVSAFDRRGIELLVGEIARRPYVAEVGEARVRWPDGLTVDVRFARPVACVLRDGVFYNLAADGTLLPGAWSSPPAAGGAGFLPRLVESTATAGVGRRARPGERVDDPAVRDALAVARSLEEHLTEADRHELGRVRIDARLADAAAVDHPGIVIDLEGRRRIWFGRSPLAGEPGEIAVERKWHWVAVALDELRAGRDWSLIDLRWDVPQAWARAADVPAAARGEAAGGE